jgi:mannose-6-phosphate isomerase-like protein (cupin superfamily)
MDDSTDTWRIFKVADLLASRGRDDRPAYTELLKAPAMSLGIYRLPAGSRDMQGAHDDDEVYYVLDGRARIRVGDEETLVEKGNVLYIKAACNHSFFEVEEDMTLLVMFAAARRRMG